jgi:hypothetical protein
MSGLICPAFEYISLRLEGLEELLLNAIEDRAEEFFELMNELCFNPDWQKWAAGIWAVSQEI